MSNKHRDIITSNLSDLADHGKINSRLLDRCVEKDIITRDDMEELDSYKGYKLGSEFFGKKIRNTDEGKFQLFYEICEEKGTRQVDDVLAILKKGLPGLVSIGGLLEYNFDNKTRTDGSAFTQVKWNEIRSAAVPIFERYTVRPIGSGGRHALMVNITAFSGQRDRDGAQYDSLEMAKVLKHYGFEVYEVGSSVTAEGLKQMIENFKKKCKDGDVCVVVIMSHGDRDVIITSGNEPVSIMADILAPFNNANFKDFAGKPKLFFFQACRGNRHDGGVPTMTDGNSLSRWETISALNIPSWTDILVCYSTLEDQYSYREENGSWFIQILCEKLKSYGSVLDISKILILVAEHMKGVVGSQGEKQICPWTNIGFTKEFYF